MSHENQEMSILTTKKKQNKVNTSSFKSPEKETKLRTKDDKTNTKQAQKLKINMLAV
jgi:hypothetical protein